MKMKQTTCVMMGILPFLFWIFVSVVAGSSLKEKECFVNACNYTHPGLQCPRGHMILITNVTCNSLNRHPCPADLYLDVLNLCSGRQSCSLRLLALEKLQGICRKGPLVTTTFTCIKKPSNEEHHEACTGPTRLSGPHGFVFSPGYPRRYSQTPCWWKIFLDRGQDVLFTIFEMQSFFAGSPHDMPDFLRVSPSNAARSCPFKLKEVVSFQEFRGDLMTIKQFRVRCHLEAEITLRQLSGAGKGVRLLLFYQVIPAESPTTEFLPGFLARSCLTPGKEVSYHVPVRRPLVTATFPTTLVSLSTGSLPTTPEGEVKITSPLDDYLGLLVGLVAGGLFTICLVTVIAVFCLRRKRAKSDSDYNSFSDGKSGSVTGIAISGDKGKAYPVTSHRDMSSGYASDSDSEEYDLPDNPTYESIDKYRLSDTYCRVVDEISTPPPAPKPRGDNQDDVSTTYAEVQSVLDERIPPRRTLSYREFLKRQLAALEKGEGRPEESTSGPYAVSGYLCGDPIKEAKVPPEVPPKSPGMWRENKNSDSARDRPGGSDENAEQITPCPTPGDARRPEIVFEDNIVYESSAHT